MSIRREPTYLSTDVWRALWLLSKSGKYGEWTGDSSGVKQVKTTSPDELADDLLRESLNTKFPQLFEHQKKVEKMEKELFGTI